MPFRLTAMLLSVILLALTGSVATARAADAEPTVMILLDGSGSMWARLGSGTRAKFEFARDALRAALPRIRPGVRLGLASFGHRRRGNCSDAEVIVPPERGNLEQVMAPLERMNATGKGPLVLGLRGAAAAIGPAAPSSIVLIHDDVDNCDQDVCAAAAEIAKANPKLAVHTIGIGLTQAKLQQMSCLARLTGGKLYDAQSAAGVASALDQIIKLAHLEADAQARRPEQQEVSESDAPAPGADAAPGLYLSAGLGPKSATLESPVHWRITKAGSDETVRDVRAPTLVEKLPPGPYEVEAQLGLASARQSVNVRADAPTPVRINLNAGVLKMVARPAKGAAPLPAAVFSVAAASNSGAATAAAPIWIGREPQPEILLPAGEYRVSAESGSARQEQTVRIAAATGTTFDAMLATGRLQLFASNGRGDGQGEALTDGVTYIIYEDDPDAPQGRREVTRSAAPAPIFTLPAGTYYVTARTSGGEVREQIAIGAGDAVRRALPLALARVTLTATLDGAPPPESLPLTFTVVSLDAAPPREVMRTVAREAELELTAGSYRLEAALGTTNVRAATDVTLRAGQSQKLALTLEAGEVTLKRAGEQGTSPNDVLWEIKDDNRRTVLRTSRPQPTALLAPGRYVVSSETRDQELTGIIVLKAGEHRTFEIGG